MKIDLRNVPDAEVSGIDLANVDITVPAPETEPQRQYYFMALLKQQLVPERAKQNGKEYLTACITTFGCQMNARDSEKLEGILETVGYHIVETEDADFVVYNTCTVRENANLRVYGRLGQLGKYKKKNPGMIISLCGCMMQEPLVVEKLKKSYHFVNLIFGTHNIYRFAEYLVSRLTANIRSSRVLILCSAAITSAATVSYRMCAAANAAGSRRKSSQRSNASLQTALLKSCCLVRMSIPTERISRSR